MLNKFNLSSRLSYIMKKIDFLDRNSYLSRGQDLNRPERKLAWEGGGESHK